MDSLIPALTLIFGAAIGAVVAWLALNYMLQTPAGGPYTDTVRHAFAVVLAIVVPVVSAIVIAAWVGALRKH